MRVGFEHPPAGCHGQRWRLVLALPRSQQITLAEQLRAEAGVDADTTDQQAAEHEQADPIAERRGICVLHRPAGIETSRARHSAGLLSVFGRDGLGQVPVLLSTGRYAAKRPRIVRWAMCGAHDHASRASQRQRLP